MLKHAILILSIVSPGKTVIDYEFYNDAKHCDAVADEINNYEPNTTGQPTVKSVCVVIEDNFTKEV